MARTVEYEFTGDTSGLKAAIKEVSSALDTLLDDADVVSRLVEDEINAIQPEDINANVRVESEGIERAKADLNELDGEMDTARVSVGELSDSLADLDFGGFADGAFEASDAMTALALAGSNLAGSTIPQLFGATESLTVALEDVNLENMDVASSFLQSAHAGGDLDGVLRAMDDGALTLSKTTSGLKGRVAALATKLKTVATSTAGVVAGIAAVAAGMIAASVAGSKYQKSLERIERQSGATASEAIALQNALASTGEDSDLNEVSQLLNEVRRGISELAEEGGDGVETLRELGISLAELDAASPVEAIQMLDEATQSLNQSARQSALEDLVGEDDARRLLSIMEGNTKALEDYEDVITGDMRRALSSFGDMMSGIAREARDLFRVFAGGSAQALEPFMAVLKPVGIILADMLSIISRLITTTFNFVGAVIRIVGEFPGVIEILQKLGEAYTWLADKLANLSDRFNDFLSTFGQGGVDTGEKSADESARAFEQADEAVSDYNDTVRDLKDEFDRGLISEEELLQGKVQAAIKRFEELREINRRFPSIDLGVKVSVAAGVANKAQAELAALTGEVQEVANENPVIVSFDLASVQGQGPVQLDVQPNFTTDSVDFSPDFGGIFSQLQEAFDVGAISLDSYREKLKELQSRVESSNMSFMQKRRILSGIEQQLRDTSATFSVMNSAVRGAASTLGSEFAAAFTGIFRKNEELTEKERIELQKQKRQLDEQLAQRAISREEHAARVKEIERKLAEDGARAIQSFGDAFKTIFDGLSDFALNVIDSIIQQLTTALATAAALKALTAAGIGGPLGSFGSVFQGVLGGSLATTTANITINGSTKTSGRDLVTTYDTQTRIGQRINTPR